MSDRTAPDWLYYKIYVGGMAGAMDHLVAERLRDIARLKGVTRWFFLRYTDEGGAHLRLRLCHAGHDGDLPGAVAAILAEALAELPRVPTLPYRPTILPPRGAVAPLDEAPDRSGGIHVQSETYEPDVETFGARGVTFAEDLFHHSSEAALRVLSDEREGKYSRKTVAPLMMTAIADAFMPDAGPSVWSDYTTYWLDGSPQPGDVWRPRFAAKAEELRARGVPVLASDDELPVDALEPVRAWRAATAAAARAFRTAGDEPPRRPYELMFHFLHSMNNRLGLMPIEEAYLSALIGQDGGRTPAA